MNGMCREKILRLANESSPGIGGECLGWCCRLHADIRRLAQRTSRIDGAYVKESQSDGAIVFAPSLHLP